MKTKDPDPKQNTEDQRLHALNSYDLLDTVYEEDCDNLTAIAAQICGVPVSLITLIDKDRQWCKSHHGTALQEIPREIAFCNHTIMDENDVLIVPDLRKDKRFAKNPLVTGTPNVVFYAGAKLTTPGGHVLGSICVLDTKKHSLNEGQVDALKALSREVMAIFELRKNIKELKLARQKLQIINESLRQFTQIVSHDIKTPVANICMLTSAFQNRYKDQFDESAPEYLKLINESSRELMSFIDGILKNTRCPFLKSRQRKVASQAIIKKVVDLVGPPADMEIKLSGNFPEVNMDKTSLRQVFQNLIWNAIKYNDKEKGFIRITSKSNKLFDYFCVSDNGPGIEKQHLQKIFNERQTLDQTDRYGNKGTGIGLATVKKLVEAYGGKISVTSQLHIGSKFKICIPHVA